MSDVEKIIRDYLWDTFGRRSMTHVCDYVDEIATDLAKRLASDASQAMAGKDASVA